MVRHLTLPFWKALIKHIAAQKRAEQQLKASEENFRLLAETVPQLMWTAQPDGLHAYTNQRWRDYTGFAPEQRQRWDHLQFIHPDDQEGTRAQWQHALDTGTMYEREERLRNGQNGEYRWFLTRAMPVHDEAGQIVKWIGTCTDIEKQKRAEQQLKESRESLRVLAETVPQQVWVTRSDGLHEYWNQRWRDYTGLTREHVQSDRWAHLQFIHPDDRAGNQALWQHALDTGTMYEHEERLRNGQNGKYRWFLTRAMPMRDEGGQIVKWFGTSTDIEDQKRAEQQLKESRENLRVLAETVPQLVWTTSPDGWVEYWNQRWYDYSGSSPAQALGHRWSQFLHPDDSQRTLKIWHHALATGEPYEIEYRLKDGQTGEYRWFLTRGIPVRDEGGQIVKWFGTATDIENQKRTEEALRQSQERIRALIESNIIGITSVEMEGEVLADANEAFLRMTGYTREEVQSRTLNRVKITSPEQAPLFERSIQELTARGQHAPFETELVCQDGSRLPVLVGGVIFQEQPRQMVVFLLDNSARKELEQRKDDFISMANHELKTPLTAVKLQIQLVRKRLEKHSQPEAATALARVEGPVKQLERLIAELLDVSRMQAGSLEYRRERVDLDELLQEVTATIHHLHPSHTILVRGSVQTSLIGDRDRLGQVFTNLLSNAIKYSPDTQTVEIDLSASDDAVTIRVRDHGLGIPREQRDKIFERFYRVTDPKRKAIPGLGMGLYIVAEIVKHQGEPSRWTAPLGKARPLR
ncbi:hypothetical protein KSC_070220 [Ktedonobacter sp. SOSP1-52]|nr:hypothetical protein KSC_070220 [Ktedonobacter sp. SOSP1-52]